jgi:stage V sporulation protein B
MISTLYLRSNIKISSNISRQNYKEENRRIIKIALPLALGSAATGASSLVDLGMIMRRLEEGGMSAEAATAAYGNYTTLAVPMLQLVASLISPLAVVLLPRLSSFHSLQEKEEFFSCLQFGMKSVAFFSVPIAAVFFFFSEPLLMLIFPAESARIAAPLLGMLSLGVLFLSALFIVNTALEAEGKVHLQMLSLLIGIIVKIPITYFLLANPSVGIAAAPIGTVFSYAASLVFSFAMLGRREAILRIFSAHAHPILNTAAACIGAFFAFGMFGFLKISALKTVLAFCVFSVIYLLFSFLMGTFLPSKQKIRQNNQISA